ncbi:MAG: lipopolysaccharide biosynthesis protein [Goleter apudmare HA4340-LM2]|jgi:PST family polysaccharide transporter|nr:lipopolysaccharide biosynthesis protein [Goleter apudmare HA4340-LM2]
MDLKQKTIQGVFWSVIQNWVSQAGSLLVFLVLARLLEPKDFGLIALANIFITFMHIFLDQGLSQALIQREKLEPAHIDTAFWIQLGLGILLTGLSFISAGWIANFFHEPKLVLVLQCLSIIFFIDAFKQVQIAILKRKFAFQIMATRVLAGILVGGIVGVVMGLAGFGVWSLVSQQLVFEFVGVIVLWSASDWRPRWQFSVIHAQELFNYGIHIFIYQFVKFLNQRTDSLLIGYFLGEVALGYYAIANRILQVMTQLLATTTNQVILSTFCRLQAELSHLRQAFYQATQFTSLIAFPTFIGMIVLTPELVTLLFGQKWIPAIPIIRILALAGMLNSVSSFQQSVFMAMGKPSWSLRLGILNTALNVLFCMLAVQWGLLAVAIAYVFSDYLVFPVGQWAVSKLIKTPCLTYLQQFITPAFSTLVMTIVILAVKYFCRDSVNYQGVLIICTLIGAVTYGLVLRWSAPKLFQHLWEILFLFASRFQGEKV